MTGRTVTDWRGELIRQRAPEVAVRLDLATGLPVCLVCEASLEGRSKRARFCSHICRSVYHMRRRRAAT